ncbi:hypothetical protein [Paenibacillus cucumis (ex Kampfer et al. 2016)]|uniref:Uncharacterized protein n=1 Tax=Paenibacillus cucumis (ex Kampfer et al. 2016) TaxID=1776858 RepID=A0ABS7KKG8_9BACL|nr:hypothetical protein [Paenibacillus cucumis (ex Kampfer et al. 2016)]MBY0204669.1 hypothetical protein [Paenibacillus cucumis (ex Kampfer et al. 2016)]
MNSLASVNKLFEITSNYYLRFNEISSKPLAEYALSLKVLEYKVHNLDESDFLLYDFLMLLRKFRFILSASPLPFSSHKDMFSGSELTRLSIQCKLMYPNLKNDIELVMDSYRVLHNSSEKPVLEYLRSNFNDKISTGLVIKTAIDLNTIEEVLKRTFITHNTFTIVTPSKLKKNNFYKRLIILGPTYWYPDFVFNCPRSQTIEIISYDWQLFRAPTMQYFIESESQISTINHGCDIVFNKRKDSPLTKVIEVNDQIVDYKKVENTLSVKLKHTTPNSVKAKLVGLTDMKGIFFEDHSIKNIWTISLQSEDQVTKCSINKLDTDSYLLIRTGTGRDIIQIKADEYLGKRAAKIRYRHSIWKKRLHKYTIKYASERICRYLRRHGGVRANEANLRNWISNDYIKPREYKDFLAIMKLVKLEEHAEKLWKEADELYRAHQRAGTVIRNLIIQEINKSNLGKLEIEQKMTFGLPDAENATFTAYKIEYVSQVVYQLQPQQLRSVIDLCQLEGFK